MFASLVLLITLLSAFGARLVRSQSDAQCLNGYNWMYNSKGQSPCAMAGYLWSACETQAVTVKSLNPDEFYGGPDSSDATRCACSTVTWSLFSACAACQNRSASPWNVWNENCTSKLEMAFPFDIPSETVVPHWVYLNYGDHWTWNADAAKADAASPKKSTPVGAIVGGVIGGLALIALLIGAYVVMRRRRAAARRPLPVSGSTSLTPPPPTTPSVLSGSEPSMNQRLYNPSDPATFPPQSYGPSTTTSPGYGQLPYHTNDTTVVY